MKPHKLIVQPTIISNFFGRKLLLACSLSLLDGAVVQGVYTRKAAIAAAEAIRRSRETFQIDQQRYTGFHCSRVCDSLENELACSLYGKSQEYWEDSSAGYESVDRSECLRA